MIKIKIDDRPRGGNWITARETKPHLDGDTLTIVNTRWETSGRGTAKINSTVVVNNHEFIAVHVSYAYHGKYRGGSQYWHYYMPDKTGTYQRITWKRLTDSQRLLVLDQQQELLPSWTKIPGKLKIHYLKPGEKTKLKQEGENIIAYKVLLKRDDKLVSPVLKTEWENGELYADNLPTEDNVFGIYACKSIHDDNIKQYKERFAHYRFSSPVVVKLAVAGTIVEHKYIIRAEYTKVLEVIE